MATTLTPLDAALRQLLDSIGPVAAVEQVDILHAPGRILATDVHAPIDVPLADNSAMDGFALRAADVAAVPVVLPVTQRIPAGHAPEPLKPGTAARIFTGAPLPAGADCVVMQENAELLGARVRVLQSAAAGENVRLAGEDIRLGSRLFHAGHRMRVQDLHALASCGIQKLGVRRRLRVALLTTGDELVAPGTQLQVGQVYNSNYFMLAGLVEALGMQVVDLGQARDQQEQTVERLRAAAAQADCIVSTGGVSVGEEDHVRGAVEKLGRISLWKLAIKPGKPFAFGKVLDKPFFGLPGNPVSGFVTFAFLVRPALLAMAGATGLAPRSYLLPARFLATSGERQEYLRVSLSATSSGNYQLDLCGSQSSGAGSALSSGDGLAVVPPFTSVRQGDMLQFVPFSEITA